MEGVLALGVPYVAILMPVLIVGVIFFFSNKIERHKYNAIIEVSKNIDNPSKLEEIIDSLNDKKKPIDYRRSGVITFFVGLGLFLFGAVSSIDILKGVGLLVAAIGIGSIVAGYLYPMTVLKLQKQLKILKKSKIG